MRDLNILTVPADPSGDGGREIFDPANAWPDAPSRIFVGVHRSGPTGVFQIGYDPLTSRTWLRTLPSPGAPWGEWVFPGGVTKAPPRATNGIMVDNEHGILIHFDLMFDPASVPSPSAFTVTVKGAAKTVVSVVISGTDLMLNMDARYASGPTLVSYAPPGSNKLRSVDGIDVEAFTDFPIEV